ncbi:MAG: protein kinase [Byssovorax sp.]
MGPFRLVRQLGRGGFAPVWLAEEIHDGKKLREVAIKLFLLPEGIDRTSIEARKWRDGILDEARALCRVEHPNVVRFYSLYRDDAEGVVGLVMEHIKGQSLDVRLRESGPSDQLRVIEVGISVAWALAAVHDAGLVHRDIKPGNILQGASGYKLIDFGIVVDRPRAASDLSALAGEPTVELVPALVGTPGYMAPELMRAGAPPSPGSDLFALGVTLFKLWRGALPDQASRDSGPSIGHPSNVTTDLDRALSGADRDARGPSGAGPFQSLDALVSALIDPDPSTRPRHAVWVARELERLRGMLQRLAGEETTPFSESGGEPSRPAPAAQPSLPAAPRRPTIPPPRAAAELDPDAPPPLERRPPLCGRDAELASLRRAAAEAGAGGARVALIGGPLGVGRTRLLEAAIEAAALPSHRVLRMSCSPERKSPLRPLLRAVEAMPIERAFSLDQVRDAIERVLSPDALPGSVEAAEALEAVEEAILWASAEEPLMLAIDDIQWGDAHTIGLLRLLVERPEIGGPGKLFVVAAARTEPSPTPALRALMAKARARARTSVSLIDLGPLAEGDAAELARRIAPIGPEVERAVVRGSGAVPFFLVHALFAWKETEALAFRDGAYRSKDGALGEVPGVAEMIDARLAACFEPGSPEARAAQKALAAVALHGGGLPVEVLFAIGGDEAAVEVALEALVLLGMLTASGERQEYGFAQEMVRQAALNLMRPKPWFFRLHRALLDHLSTAGEGHAEAGFLASGYEKLGDADKARHWLGRARAEAASAGLFVEAVDFGDRLAALTPVAETRIAVDLDTTAALVRGRMFEEARRRLDRLGDRSAALGGASGRALDVRRRVQRLQVERGLQSRSSGDPALIADADALGDPALRCEARMALAGVLPEAEALPLAGEAIDLAPDPSMEFVARVLRAELCYASNHRDLAQTEGDLRRALAIASSASSLWQQVHIAGDLAVIEAELGHLDAAIRRLGELAELAEARGMRGQLRLLLINRAAFLLRADRDEAAAETAGRLAALSAEAGDPALSARALSIRGRALQRIGRLDEALADITRAEQLQRGDRSRALTLLRRAEILDALGRFDEALADARSAGAVAEQHQDQDLVYGALLWETLRLSRRGEVERAALEALLGEIESAPVTLRVPTKILIDEAKRWLAG